MKNSCKRKEKESISQKTDSASKKKQKAFTASLFENNELITQVVRHHRDNFAALYKKCKLMKNSFMQFQKDWYNYCISS